MNHRIIACLLFLALAKPRDCFKSAVVVGAGPAGLASALVLAQRHGYQVTVLEASNRTDVYDPAKAYPFLIRERGQKLTNLFPQVQQALETRGIATEGATKLVSIPADPKEILDSDPKPIPVFRPAGKSYWIRRHEFIRLLLDAAMAEERITIINGAQCSKISGTDSEIEICTQGSTNQTFRTSLLLGCDGMNSQVRESLATSPSLFPDWANNDPDDFKVKRWFSPASGLRFKTLQINSDAKVPVGDGTMFEIPFDTQTFYSIRSTYKSPKQAISLGLLPSRKAPVRTFNVIRLPNHEIWSIKDGNELREWFAKAFPRFDFSAESSLVEKEEFERFATTEGLQLPPCQYSPEIYTVSRDAQAAVILVGDAVHTFPPDLGEGVNSGLEDVMVSSAVLDGALG
jgi:2-polyprenyl-6-methoxyphenol hydroxylase-like FAD-dependent oxidoreductase